MDKSRLLCLDIGHKRTGVAVSDETRSIASPMGVIHGSEKGPWLLAVQEYINRHEVGGVVVGIPLNQDGEEGRDALEIRKFIALLQERAGIAVIEWDERFSTVQAERRLIEADVSRKKRKGVIDKVAAAIILQSYLDSLTFRKDT
jgi:putative Holliday junction resolvase